MKTKNFFKLTQDEQRALIQSAIKNADDEQATQLQENSDKVTQAKHELIDLLNQILNQDFSANDKIVFTQTDNGMDVTIQ